MRETQSIAVDLLAATVDELYRKFGAWKTARALMTAVLRRRQAQNQISHLSNRMRRDIGLPDAEEEFSVLDIGALGKVKAVRPD
ncbi:DUF1127 domain-containing protein [Sinorhizobium medicae]|nr:DUF1127 domain-containing protein [Sinorhizobium medicae]MDX0490308.1 DUF1127 domain-containing protein [Sinorhizobium medicae]MDX0871690.1 DUF1127 domain-containing protein [Sinorhizobium medicae]MDX0951990.1 DUF1127 domain-containing protein [Sinorhizobium medicae]MDX1035894.1 DUF1127 domain-containing protein [Sinorhizobium medicae]